MNNKGIHNKTVDHNQVVDNVRDQYAAVAQSDLSNESSAVRSIAAAFGYSQEDLNQLPPEANMGLSCGNPLALAGIRSGEVVVDLGCGGGMDVFLAARRVGPTGRVIGIDMTTEMLERARAGQQKLGLTNVEFYQSNIETLPLPDNSVDCVISNCVINLVPDKLAVFREILRVLKPGGRVALSDIALKQTLPAELKQSVEAYVGCIAGAVQITEYRNLLEQAGFSSVVVTDTGADLNAYSLASNGGCCGGGTCDAETTEEQTSLHDGLAAVMRSVDANALAASVRVHALKQTSAQNTYSLPVFNLAPVTIGSEARTIQVYDKPMCCSTGVCGPEVDPVFPQFAADLEWLKNQGHRVQRYNLAQQPQAFIENAMIHHLLSTEGTNCLPIVVVDSQIVSRQVYPSRDMFLGWIEANSTHLQPTVPPTSASCCGSSGCC